MRRVIAIAALMLAAGCNAILGNGDFRGPGTDDAGDAAASDACTGIGCMVVDCARQGKPPTSVSGTVFAPDGQLPLYNALVYVPTTPLDPLGDGPATSACASGKPAVHAFTDVSGHFKLDNVPSVANLPLVIQVGKWRREIAIAVIPDCDELKLPATDTRLPRNSSEGHLPHIAVSTGAAESLECVGRSVGISDGEHTVSSGAGRVHLYAGPGSPTGMIGTVAMETVDALYDRMAQYDLMLLSCDGQPLPRPQQKLLDYVTGGGWVWLSHFQNVWIAPPTPFPPFAMFDLMSNMMPPSPIVARIDTTSPKGQAFADWMLLVGGSPQPGLMTIENGRTTCMGVDTTMAQRNVFFDPAVSSGVNGVQMLSWTPGGRGRLVFSDIHLQQPVMGMTSFPTECQPGPLTAQGKSIAFQLFDQPTCLP